MSTDQAYRSNPFPLYTSLRETEPVAKGSVNGMTGWLVTRYDLVRPLLTDSRLSSNPAHEGEPAQPRVLRIVHQDHLVGER
jgi:cytochrome P450 monooxygenase